MPNNDQDLIIDLSIDISSFLHNKTPSQDYIIKYQYSIFDGYYYTIKGSPIIILKHLIIDPIQDSLIKLGLDNLIKFTSGHIASYANLPMVKPNLSPGMAHQFMHKLFSPILKLFGLDEACNHETIETITAPNNNDDSESSFYDDNSLVFCQPCTPLTPEPTLCKNNDCATPHFSKSNQHPQTFMTNILEEYVMHSAVKGIAIGLFPIIYSMNNINMCNKYKFICNTVKFFGINPSEGIYLFHSITSKITPKSYSNLVENAEFYLNYEHLKEDQQAYEYLTALDLYLEGVDALIHGADNLELIYNNRDLPGISIISGAMVLGMSILYYNTEIHENELGGNILSVNEEL